ncbi:MAG: hemolysin family protein [Rickettsiaceae bacterium]|nr:hemolysin family protein [Rickettsiaceae bacterium]MDP4832913.1 hemolysin family protein [Rickettsiaceae bacterium]MDP5021193.1 hemolysin family protein [Rickettsiaceae bacterium]MDP5083746.1 hemolysin family protein [Rickettsiaceae bacterium]
MPKDSDKEDPMVGNKTKSTVFSKLKSLWRKDPLKQENLKSEQSDISELPTEGEILNNLGSFSEKTLDNIMIPRSDIISVGVDTSLEELSALIVKHAHTRTLVYQERLDDIIGFIHIKDLFEVIVESKKFNLKRLLRKHIVAPHSMKLIDLLTQMQRSRTHIAIVVDEYGGTDGLVTIEDIIEEIVGNIDDEHDIGIDEDYRILKPGLIVTSARVEIQELENVLGIQLSGEDDEFDTIGGFIMAKSGSVPEKGEVIHITEDIIAEILEATPRTIKQIKLTYTAK